MNNNEQNPKKPDNKQNQGQTNQQGNNAQSNFDASNQDITPQNNKEGNNIRIEDNSTGLDYLREELKERNKTIQEKDSHLKEVYQQLLKKNQQYPYAVLVATILVCLAIIFNTEKRQESSQTQYIAQNELTIQDTAQTIHTKKLVEEIRKKSAKRPLRKIQKLKPTIQPQKTEQRIQINPNAFKPNEMLEKRVSGKTSLLQPAGKHKHILRFVGDAMVVSFARDSSLINKPLKLYIRTNNIFDKPVKSLVLQDGAAYMFYKSDFRKGLYYVEIIQEQNDFTLFTGKFEVR